MTEEKLLTVSWSRLRSWLECKQKAYLQSSGVKNVAVDNRGFHRGTVTDRVLRQWLQDEHRLSGQMPSMVDEYMELCEQEYKDTGNGIVRWKSSDDKSKTTEWCKVLLSNLEPILDELVVPHFPFVDADKHFKVNISIPGLDGFQKEIQLIGIMDIFIDSPQKLAIYDLKATEDEYYWKKTIMQLVFYNTMIQAIYDRKPESTALIQPMCKNKVMYIDITPEHELTLMTNIINYAHSVWSRDFAPKDSDTGCSYCAVRNACEKFKADDSGRLSWV